MLLASPLNIDFISPTAPVTPIIKLPTHIHVEAPRILSTNWLLHLMGKSDYLLPTFCHIKYEHNPGTAMLPQIFFSTINSQLLIIGRQFFYVQGRLLVWVHLILVTFINFCITHCKYYIFSCKLNNTQHNCYFFVNKL